MNDNININNRKNTKMKNDNDNQLTAYDLLLRVEIVQSDLQSCNLQFVADSLPEIWASTQCDS